MKQINNCYVSELQGYLNCIARLCANAYAFGVSAFEMEDDIDEFALKITEAWGHGTEYIEPSSYIYLERNKVESEFLFEQLESFIFMEC